ncbi:calmodulin-binding protein 25-like [Panicum virgatum]|uniref:VQ domain-containing protein n=1 Tax=Panicum virgatum TaxID=38727 RepID=A0A8T0PGN6_PANVG|nr:calmodulin-binding protein 25-like [Panicum virgatum]KAG2559799.1 hypothetical protein PVAP13_8KG008800 [Panicum virgatum]
MLMTAAAVHMDSAHCRGLPPSSSTSPAPPWLPVLADDNHHHQLLRDFTASSAPSHSTPSTAAPPSHHHHLRTAATATRRSATKRRPRPSRKLPTTYITADPTSFRRMVHQVTGADDLLPAHPPEAALCRPAPYRVGAAGPGGALTTLPTLDTSAFLLGAAGSGVAAPCAGSAGFSTAAPAVDRAEAGGPPGGACNYSSGSSCGGFPTLDSWDAHLF